MNICLIIDNVFPSFGGLGKTTERFSLALKKKGHKITVITARRNNQKEVDNIRGIKIYHVKSKKMPFALKEYPMLQAVPEEEELKKILIEEKIEIIHLLSYAKMGKTTLKVAKGLKIPLIFGLHVQPENLLKPIHLNFGIFRRIVINRLKLMCESGYGTITPTEFSKKLISDYGIKNKIFVISNGINLKEFNNKKTSDKAFKKKYGLKGKRFILYVGRIMQDKNIKILIDACKIINWNAEKNKDLYVVIIGEGPEKERLMERAKKYGLKNRVIFTGRLDNKMLKSAYKSSEFLVHPSLIELQGMTLLESMAFGKPILVSNSEHSAAPTIISGNGMKFNPFDAKELAEKIQKLVNNKKLIKKLGRNSLKLTEVHNFNKSVKKMEEAFKEAIEKTKLKDL